MQNLKKTNFRGYLQQAFKTFNFSTPTYTMNLLKDLVYN